jgi:hypothetical protein
MPAVRGPDWLSLPQGVLQHIIGLASTWQKPGSCAAAPVCSTWKAAAAGCRGTRLLYTAFRSKQANASFATWLGFRSRQLGSLILSSSEHSTTEHLLGVLALAAETAAATGRPLQLHTLRVLGYGPSFATTGRLLAGLPRLRHLQLPDLNSPYLGKKTYTKDVSKVQQQLASLQQATQLEQLRLQEVQCGEDASSIVAGLLPASLQRLNWHRMSSATPVPDLAHLTRLTSIRLDGWRSGALSDSKLPAGLQELDLTCANQPQALPQEQLPLVTGVYLTFTNLDDLSSMSKLRSISMYADYLCDANVSTAVAQLTSLSALTVVRCGSSDATAAPAILQGVLSTAASIQGLRQLDIRLESGTPHMPGLSRMTGLTRLVVTGSGCGTETQHHGWTSELGRMPGLRRLSLPLALLLLPDHSWLGNMTQLQVLEVAVHLSETPGKFARRSCQRRVQRWLDGESLRVVPPQLLLLMMFDMTAEEAASLQLRRRLQQQLVGRSECEVVVGGADPERQLAGLPEALQQALE